MTVRNQPNQILKDAVNETQVISFGENVPNIEIECNSCISNLHKRVSQNSMVHISSYFNNLPECSLSRVRYEWSIIQSNSGKSYNTNEIRSCDQQIAEDACLFNFGPEDTTTGKNSKNLIIRQGVLENEKYYFFNLTVYTSDSDRSIVRHFPGLSQIRLLPDKLPQGGTCNITVQDRGSVRPDEPYDMVAVDGEIEFKCEGWTAGEFGDAPLLYSLGFTKVDPSVCSEKVGTCSTDDCNSFDQTTLYEGSQNQYTSLLPVGCNQVCVRVKVKTGSSVTGVCGIFNVLLPTLPIDGDHDPSFHVWLRLRTRHLSRLVRSNEDLATITSYASSLLSVLNSQKLNSVNATLNAEIRLDVMNILNENTEAMVPTSILESSQMAATFLMVIEYPAHFQPYLKIKWIARFFLNATELIHKTVTLYNASTDEYHRFNSTLTTAVDNLFSICGYLVEILLDFGYQVGTDDPSLNELLLSITRPINELTFKVGEWTVVGEEPTIRSNIGGSKLSIRQSRLSQSSYGVGCTREQCHSVFELNGVRVDINDLNHSDLFGDLPPNIEILNTLLVFNLLGENNAFDTPLLSFQFRKFIGSVSEIAVQNLTAPINLELPRFEKDSMNTTIVVLEPLHGAKLDLNSTGPNVNIGLDVRSG